MVLEVSSGLIVSFCLTLLGIIGISSGYYVKGKRDYWNFLLVIGLIIFILGSFMLGKEAFLADIGGAEAVR